MICLRIRDPQVPRRWQCCSSEESQLKQGIGEMTSGMQMLQLTGELQGIGEMTSGMQMLQLTGNQAKLSPAKPNQAKPVLRKTKNIIQIDHTKPNLAKPVLRTIKPMPNQNKPEKNQSQEINNQIKSLDQKPLKRKLDKANQKTISSITYQINPEIKPKPKRKISLTSYDTPEIKKSAGDKHNIRQSQKENPE